MSTERDRTLLAVIVALLVFSVAWLAISVVAWAMTPDEWGAADYDALSEYMAEQGASIIEIVIPGLLAATVYKLVKGDSNGTESE